MKRVAADDRARIDQHLTALGKLKFSLRATPTGDGVGCAAPTLEANSPKAIADTPKISANMVKVLVAALACGITRVGSIQWTRATGHGALPWLQINEDFHGISHSESNPAAVVKLVKINNWFAQEVAELLRQLQLRSENNGTMLDNSLILWGSKIATGNHTEDNVPFALFGKAGGALKGGRLVESNSAHHNRMMVSLCNLMDVPTQTFGAEKFQQGPLPGLV